MNNPAIPSLKRRLASMLYEAMLLFGVLFVSALLFATLLQQHSALYLRHFLQYWLFVVMGMYFIWFWTHGGQTLAMKTWHIRLETRNGSNIGAMRAVGRYLLAWLWFVPGLVLAWALEARQWELVLIPAVNLLAWTLTAYLDPNRQFLHDRIAGTRIVITANAPQKARPQ